MLPLPDHFVANMHGIHGDRARVWLAQFPAHLDALAAQWHLALEPAYPLSYNYVCPATDVRTGELLVLKTSLATNEFATETALLRLYDGRNAIRLVAVDTDRAAALLERATPGTRLNASGLPDAEQTAIAAGIFRDNWVPIPARHAFPALRDQCAILRELPAGFPAATATLGAQHVAAAVAIIDRLGHVPATHVLHSDFHHENILRHGDRWVIIDPKGVTGIPAQECAAFLRNPGELLESGIDVVALTQTRIETFAQILGIPAGDIAAWNYALMVLAAWWCAEDGGEIPAHAITRIHEFRAVASTYEIPEAH